MNQEKYRLTVEHISKLLEQEQYAELEVISRGIRLSAKKMQTAIETYGRKLVPLPEGAYQDSDIIEVLGTDPKKWSVNVALYMESEGRSDLLLSLTFFESSTRFYKIEIDDIQVL